MGIHKHFDAKELFGPPIKRAAYSDRTAWLMAEMSRLAYDKFEGGISLKELALKLSKDNLEVKDREKILHNHLLSSGLKTDKAREDLAEQLAIVNFKLINVYNRDGTQAFLAQINEIGREKDAMLVLAFRGTEPVWEDIKADIGADLHPITSDQKVHRGFYNAFNAVKAMIEKDLSNRPDIPIYITGHSLGGALAIMATKFLASDSLGACYTYGSPRVGNSLFQDDIKTPIYRIINSADGVPRMPPSWGVDVLISALKWIPVLPNFVVEFLQKFRGYVHYGDMRYLSQVAETKDANDISYNGLKVISNPSMILRSGWVLKRWISTFGKAAAHDHSVDIYCEKLKAHGLRRSLR